MPTLTPGAQAPELALPTLDGRSVTLSQELARGPVVLAFAKAECRTCHLAFPYLERLRRAYPGDGWQMLGVFQDTPADAAAFAQTHQLTFPIALDADPWPASQAFDPEATPTLFLVDADGTVARVLAGFRKADLNELAAELARRLGEPPVVVAPPDDGKPAFRPG